MTLDGARRSPRIFLGHQFLMSLLHSLGYVFLLLALLLRRDRLDALGPWFLMTAPFLASGGGSLATFVFEDIIVGTIVGTIVLLVARFGLVHGVTAVFLLHVPLLRLDERSLGLVVRPHAVRGGRVAGHCRFLLLHEHGREGANPGAAAGGLRRRPPLGLRHAAVMSRMTRISFGPR
jgi:hypothetical protein